MAQKRSRRNGIQSSASLLSHASLSAPCLSCMIDLVFRRRLITFGLTVNTERHLRGVRVRTDGCKLLKIQSDEVFGTDKSDEMEAAARSHAAAVQLLAWDNESVGPGFLKYAKVGKGCRIHILDTTPIEVAIETGNYECSGVVKDEGGQFKRGYKLATLRTRLDTAGLLTQVGVGQIQTHDSKLCGSWLCSRTVLRPGDLVLEDRGFLDGATITE